MLVLRTGNNPGHRIIFLTVFCCLQVSRVAAEYGLTVTGYDTPLVFNGKKIVLIQKGDDPAYKEVLFDDSAWNVISLPSEWERLYPGYNGICWYRLHLYLPDALPAAGIGISLGVICDADEVYLNGSLIGRSGTIDGHPGSAYDKIRIYELPAALLLPGRDNVLALRIKGGFTYSNGPYTGIMKIDKYANLLREYYSRELFDLVFVSMHTMVGFYFLLFFIRRRENKADLFFALFALGVSCYFFLRTQFKYLLNLPFFQTKKLEYLVLCWLIFLIMEFLVFYFKKKHRWIHFVFLGLTSLFFLIILFSNSYIFWDYITQYFMIPSWLIGVTTIFYILISRLKSEFDARLIFCTMVILLFTLINDILVNMVFYKFIRISNYGFIFFTGSIAIILSNRFIRLHSMVADLNINLEQKVLTRTGELNRTVRQLASAKKETDNILRNVQEGIFLLDRSLCIGSNYSHIMETIFAKRQLGGITLPGLLKDIAAPGIQAQAGDFLDIFFTHNMPEKRLAQLNPLEEVKVVIKKENREMEKYLNFAFTRIKGEMENTFILGTVRDITEQKLLALKIKATEKQAEKESRLYREILHLNPQLLMNFLIETRLEIRNMEELLKQAQFSGNLKVLLKNIFTSVHTVKGDAGMLEIKSLAEVAHLFENSIRDLYNKPEIQALELINLPYGLADMKAILARIEKIIEKIIRFRSTFADGTLTDQDYIAESIRNMADRVAAREHKSIRLELRSFRLPADLKFNILALKHILMQLVKNAVVHGIQSGADRERVGKPAAGRIIVKSEPDPQNLTIKVTDDGGNLDLDRIRQTVLKTGMYSKEELAALPEEKLALMIFETGISTRENLTIDAGRGIGLVMVKDAVKELKGEINLVYTKGKYTQFRITLPLAG